MQYRRSARDGGWDGAALEQRPNNRARAKVPFRRAIGLALASDTASITIMEIVDNAVMLIIPGAMVAGLGDVKFWGSLAVALLLAGVAAYPVNRWLIARGRGHAIVMRHHDHHH
jgi:hypothetical protein